MHFRICQKGERLIFQRDVVELMCEEWDDSSFRTTFSMCYYDRLGRRYDIGTVKIGRKGMKPGCVADGMYREFLSLSDEWFSLGQDESYYEKIAHLGEGFRVAYLTALRDVAFDLKHLVACKDEDVMKKSILSGYSGTEVALFTVRGQLHRMAAGGARLTKYHFAYTAHWSPETELHGQTRLEFEVDPDSKPPSNVHVLIGRNGAGKTHLIRNMIRCLQSGSAEYGRFTYQYSDQHTQGAEFANVLCIAFSPFDDFSSLGNEESVIPWSFVGLDKKSGDLLQSIEEQFWTVFSKCAQVERKRTMWLDAIEILRRDPTFLQERIEDFMLELPGYSTADLDGGKQQIMEVFHNLSSGHKVVLLIVTSCVEKIEERSIVFLDEPENHLHPPLLSSLIRALSDLLQDRNGVAIVSTHSPVVLQEVPTRCVWRLSKFGQQTKAERLKQQTFGTNVSSLTNDVFRLAVDQPGFYQLLAQEVDRSLPKESAAEAYDRILADYGHQLGDEAQMLLWTLLSMREEGDGR